MPVEGCGIDVEVAGGAASRRAAQSHKSFDAAGRVVCSGRVDIHSHHHASSMRHRLRSSSPWHRVISWSEYGAAVAELCYGVTLAELIQIRQPRVDAA